VLNTGCEPVALSGDEIVITFPFPFLGDKLGSPKRKAEIQDSLTEVLGTSFRLRLVLASDYSPPSQETSSVIAPVQPTSSPPASTPDETYVPEQISRWAEEHGAKARIVPPQENGDE
jgi:hypothetical protein